MTTTTITRNGSKPQTAPILAPHSIEAEEAVLGSAIIAPDKMAGLCDILKPDDFFELKHGWIWSAMQALYSRDDEIDDLTVVEELRRAGHLQECGGLTYITRLISEAPAQLNAGTYARLVQRAAIRRKALALASKVANETVQKDADTLAMLQEWQAELNELTARAMPDPKGESVLDMLAEWHDNPADVRGYATGIKELDETVGGFERNELVIMLGYSGSGKSTMAMQFALEFAKQGPGLIIPTEMSVFQWKVRMVAYLLGTNYQALRRGQYQDWARIEATVKAIDRMPIHWHGNAEPTPDQIVASVRALKARGGIDWVLVDGLHDIKGNGEIYERTNQAIDALHACAHEGLLVLSTGHINRGATQEPNPRDALGSSRIEQRATCILTLYRPGQMLESGEIAKLPDGLSPNMATLRVAKSRFSETGQRINLMFAKVGGRHGFYPVARGT